MKTRSVLLLLLFLQAAPLFAQRGELSLGVNGLYYPTGAAGLGGTLDYRWRLRPHTELIGQFSGTHLWSIRTDRDHPQDQRSRGVIPFGGVGIGYRGGMDGRGFHIGVLAGGMRVETVTSNDVSKPTVLPALGLSVGHGIGKRMDVSLDTWMVKTTKDELFAIPFLRLSYALFRKN